MPILIPSSKIPEPDILFVKHYQLDAKSPAIELLNNKNIALRQYFDLPG